MKTLITVSLENIKNGKQGVASACPVSLAVREHFSDASIISVYDIILLTKEDKQLSCLTPDNVLEWIHKFDNGDPVDSISFQIPFVSSDLNSEGYYSNVDLGDETDHESR